MSEAFQRARSQAEMDLPESLRKALDRARAGFDLETGRPLTREEAKTFVNSWLPEGDPGRI